MLIYLLDTNAWIHATKYPEGSVARRLFPAADRRELAVSVVVELEGAKGLALACRLYTVTHNRQHFERVPRLAVKN